MKHVYVILLLVITSTVLWYSPSIAITRLGLYHTQEEVWCWRQRAGIDAQGSNGITCPVKYKVAGDVSTNSPGDWNRIVANRATFVANPSQGRWLAPFTNAQGCVPANSNTYGWPEAVSEGGNGGIPVSSRIRDTAFYGLVTGSTTDRAALKTELLWIATQTFTQWGNALPWCFGVIFDSAPATGIGDVLMRLLLAYDYMGRSAFTQPELDTLDRWFFDASDYWRRDMDNGIDGVFADRWNGNYGRTSTCDTPAVPWVSTTETATTIQSYGKFYNNRRAMIIRFTGVAALHLQQVGRTYTNGRYGTLARAAQSGKLHVQEYVRFSLFPQGFLGDFERRNSGQAIGPELGWAYSGGALGSIVTLADAWARTGDVSLYQYNTSLGDCGTAGTINDGSARQGQNRDLRFAVQSHAGYRVDRYARYWPDTSTVDNRIDGRNPRSTGAQWHGVHENYYVQGNMYFQDSLYKQIYTRTVPGLDLQYPAIPDASPRPWEGDNAIYPGILFMYGQLEGIILPYPGLFVSDPHIYYTRTAAPLASDSNTCTTAHDPSTPKKTINSGVSCLSAGDTLIVGDGVYTDVVVWYWYGHQRSGTVGNPITIKSENRRGAIIRPGVAGMGQGLGGGRNIFGLENQSYWLFDGFITDGSGMSGVIHYNFVGASANNNSVLNGEMRYGADNNTASNTLGVSTDIGETGHVIRGNYIHDLGTGAVFGQSFYSYGIYFTGSNSLIEGNEISYCSGHGMHMHNTQASADNNIMRGNVIHHNGIPSGGNSPGVLWAAGGDGNSMYNNVIYANSGSGVRLGGAGAYGSGNTVSFNTIVQNGSEGIIVGAGYCSDNNFIQNNILDANSVNTVVFNCSSGNTSDHNLGTSVAPATLFVNPTGLDFHLLASAFSVIDQGVSGTGITFDSDNITRGTPPDLGAYEFGGVGGPSGPVTVYVSPSGDDVRSCDTATNIATPKKTLLSAITCMQWRCSTIYLRAGVYVEQFDTSVPGQGVEGGFDWSCPTKIAGYSDEVAVIKHPPGGSEFIIALNKIQYLVLDRLVLDGDGLASKTGLGVYGTAHHIRLQNSVVKNTGWANVSVNSNNVELIGNVFQNALAAPLVMVGGSDSVVIRNNVFTTGDREAIGPNGTAVNTNYEISRNVISGTGTALVRAAVILYVTNTTGVYNNVVYSNNAGINVQAGAVNTKVYNNTVYGNVNSGIQVDAGAATTDIKNNIVYSNGSGIVNNAGGSTTLLTNLLTNPPFVSPGTGDFKLDASASGAIDVGTNVSPFVVSDRDNVVRPQGVGYDIGAYEFVGTPLVLGGPTKLTPLWKMNSLFDTR